MSNDFDLFKFGKERMMALTDGIFAISMTILVLDIKPPEPNHKPTDAEMLNTLSNLAPGFFAFVASFIILGMYFMGHHAMFRVIDRMDRTTSWLNIYYLLFVSLVPFTTGMYAGHEDSRVANTVFGANLIILGLLAYAMWTYSVRVGHAGEEVPADVKEFTSRRLLTSPLLAAIGLAASLIQPVYAEYIYFAMVPIFMFSVRFNPEKIRARLGNKT